MTTPTTIAPEVGQVWRVGAHLFMCSDLMAPPHLQDFSALLADVDTTPRPTLVYTDPPWNQGLANGFRTKAGLAHADYHWTEIYRLIADMAEHLEVPLYAEGPKIDGPWGREVPGAMRFRHRPPGTTERGYWPITYFGGKPSGLYYAGATPAPTLEFPDPEGWAVVRHVLDAYPAGVVVDPCAGLGGIPLTAEQAGWTSVNNELNPDRLRVAIERMAKATNATPERVR